MRTNKRSATVALIASFIAFSAGMMGVTSAQDFDRLRGLIEPVKAKKPYRVAFTAVHFIDDYWKGVAYGIIEEAKLTGVDVVRVLSAGGYGKIPEQIAQLETLAALDLDAV